MGSGLRLGEGNGMVGLENQNEYNCIDFQRLVKISGCDAKYKHFKEMCDCIFIAGTRNKMMIDS